LARLATSAIDQGNTAKFTDIKYLYFISVGKLHYYYYGNVSVAQLQKRYGGISSKSISDSKIIFSSCYTYVLFRLYGITNINYR